MARRQRSAGAPNSFVVSGVWPDAVIDDPAAAVAQHIAVALRAAMGSMSLRDVAAMCGLNHMTVSAVLTGSHWPTVATIALLEAHLGTRLWPSQSAVSKPAVRPLSA